MINWIKSFSDLKLSNLKIIRSSDEGEVMMYDFMFEQNFRSSVFIGKYQFNAMNLHRVRLNQLNLTGFTWVKSNLRGAFIAQSEFKNCHFIGAHLITLMINDCHFENCIFENCVMKHMQIIKTNFVNCRINSLLDLDFM
ncbi:pentapeptide repeat-containing protein [Acinetobacter piscicola]|nr:pentapeptide repeat-containing protein [Acinetobacter piscicola]RYL27621.1 hypothetical protein EWP19_05320 [Acinetobacter piscicola]